MLNIVNGRKVISCRRAAELLGVTMGRVRQIAQEGVVWSERVTERALILDEAEVKHLAKLRQKARDAGMVPGKKPGGFKPERKKTA